MAPSAVYLQRVASTPLRDRPRRKLHLADEVLEVRVRESSRASTARIIVGPQRPLEVIVPVGFSNAEVDELLETKRLWIAGKVEASRAIAARLPQLGLDRPRVVWLEGGLSFARALHRSVRFRAGWGGFGFVGRFARLAGGRTAHIL